MFLALRKGESEFGTAKYSAAAFWKSRRYEDSILFANEICSSGRGLSREKFRGNTAKEKRVIEATDRFPERRVAFRSAGVTGRDI